MSEKIRLAVLGGSSVATPQLVRALASRRDLPPVDLVLLGRSEGKLAQVAAVSRRLAAQAPAPLQVSHTTDLLRGLEGADYVLNQVRVGGYAARVVDETFPQAFGIPGEETVGPGGLNNVLRTVPVTLEYCRAIEAAAPEALLINLTNPSSFIQYAVTRYTQVQVVGVCDSPLGLARAVARLLGAPVEEVWAGYVGMHHFGWLTEVRWKGQDRMEEVLARIEELPGLPVDADFVRAIGAVPTSYFKYYYHPDRMLERQRGQKSRAEQLIELEDRLLVEYAALASSGDGSDEGVQSGLEARGAHWYEDIVVPVMLAHAQDTRQVFTLNIRNAGSLPWLPPEAIVELPVVVARHGFLPLEPPSAPPDIQAMLHLNACFEMLWVEAVVERSYEKALRALALSPLIANLDQARAILKEIWPDGRA